MARIDTLQMLMSAFVVYGVWFALLARYEKKGKHK